MGALLRLIYQSDLSEAHDRLVPAERVLFDLALAQTVALCRAHRINDAKLPLQYGRHSLPEPYPEALFDLLAIWVVLDDIPLPIIHIGVDSPYDLNNVRLDTVLVGRWRKQLQGARVRQQRRRITTLTPQHHTL